MANIENTNYYDEYDENAFSCFLQTNFGAASNNLNEMYKELGIISLVGSGGSVTTNLPSVSAVSSNSINNNNNVANTNMANNGLVIV